jgi:hypothetical protein
MKSYRYRRKMNRHWSISTSRHRSEDDKTICEERALIDDLFFWISSIILFVMKSEIIFRDFSYIWLRFLSLIVNPRCSAARERIEFRRSILLNLVSIKFVPLRSQSILDLRKSSNSCKSSQVIKFLQPRTSSRISSR